jgi:hypothetical protein
MNAIPACFSFIESARLLTSGHGVGSFDVTTVEVVTHIVFKKTLSGARNTREVEKPEKSI